MLDDRETLQRRMHLALSQIRNQPEVDGTRIAAMGFCFGGLCVLDLARSGADVLGVVSFHGLFGSPGNTGGNRISARVLALHGWDDLMATPDQVIALADEIGYEKGLVGIDHWRRQAFVKLAFVTVGRDGQAIDRANIYAGVAFGT